MRVYLDNCCYNRPFDDQGQDRIHIEAQAKLNIQQKIRYGSIELVTSYILVAENAANRFESKRNDIQNFIDQYTGIYVSETNSDKVKAIANDIMDAGIKLMDACHVACAIIAGCDYFISTDKRLLKYRDSRIKIVNPVVYVVEED
ncbi:MAG: type II toxin-antitoxin system VapC family toxin [Eubacteriales bacterium]|nr:type II toxin-antitoxin system VapC family toxin [Eubacteriales bacterium]